MKAPAPPLLPGTRKLILVEGADNKALVVELLKKIGTIPGPLFVVAFDGILGEHDGPEIHDFGGVEQLRPYLATLVKTAEFAAVERIAVVRDAERAGETAAFQSVQDACRNAGLVAPTAIGTYSQGRPQVGMYLLPGQGGAGALEDLCWQCVPQPVQQCIDAYLECCAAAGVDVGRHRHKRRMAAWLAARMHNSYLGLAEAIGGKYFDLDDPLFDVLRRFLGAL